MSVNILITSVSRKVWLVNAFKNALRLEGIDGKVISMDVDPLSAGLYVSDKFYFAPLSSDHNFIHTVLKICKKEKIKLLVPTRDGELLLFAKNKEKFEKQGVHVMVSNQEVIKICSDKYRFYQFLIKNNILTPKTYLPHQVNFSSLHYPLIIKSRYGSGSKNTFKIKNENELNFLIRYVSDPLIQEFVNGKEYTIDVFSDFDGNVLTIVPRERIETVGGESYKGKTIKNTKIIKSTKKLAEKLGVIGHVTIQCILDEYDIKFTEINPRFGGGAALGIRSGANTPLLLIKIILGEKIKPTMGQFKENLIMLRHTEDIFLFNGKVIDKNDTSNSF